MIITDGFWITSTTSVDELHRWANKHDIKRHWFHGTKAGRPRYKLPYRKLGLAHYEKQATAETVLAYAKAIALVYNGNSKGKKKAKVLSPYRKHLFRIGQHVFAKWDDIDPEWIHSIITGRTGSVTNPTYSLTDYYQTSVVHDIPQKQIRRLS